MPGTSGVVKYSLADVLGRAVRLPELLA